MNRTRISWEGIGYYVREQDYQGAAENGISIIGHVWRKRNQYAYNSHWVTSPKQITRTFEPRYWKQE